MAHLCEKSTAKRNKLIVRRGNNVMMKRNEDDDGTMK